MKTNIKIRLFCSVAMIALSALNTSFAQLCEWRLTSGTYSAVDPDGAGPAAGSVTFTLQVHTLSGTITDVTGISTGYNYQSTKAMLPTTITNCSSTSNPTNVAVSSAFSAGGFSYLDVNQCSTPVQTGGGETFDRRAVGTLQASGAGVVLTTAWMDVFTVTLWTLGSSYPEGGYVSINSGAGGAPNPFNSYAISDQPANEYIVNSLTFNTPLAIGGTLPVQFTKFETKCTNTGTLISWATAQESNSSSFEIERSTNGSNWINVGSIGAAGNSAVEKAYQQVDLNGGNAFYRIKQVDKDGGFVYTAIERANCAVKTITTLIYPVPATDVLNIVIKSDHAVRTQLQVFDIHGKLVKTQDANVQNGNNNFRINLNGLASGDYIIRSNDASLDLNKVFTIAR